MLARCITLCVLAVLVTPTLQQDEGGEAVAVKVENLFDCGRDGMECFNNGTCADDTGLCTCLDEYTGPGCEYNASLVTDMCDDCDGAPCVSEDDGTSTCICPEDKHGVNCEYPRVSLLCNPDSMEVSIAPVTNDGNDFGGKIYVRDQAIDDGCYLTADPEMAGGFKATLMLNSCGNATIEEDDEGNDEVSFSVVVQYNPFIQTVKDQIFTFVCEVLQSGGDQDLDTSMLESDSDNSPLQEQTVKEDLKPVTQLVLDGSGAELTAPVQIGDIVTLQYTLNGGDVYNSFKIIELTATNGLTGAAEETMPFVREGCVVPAAKAVVQDFSGDPATSVKLLFKAFKFLRSYQVSFRSKVKLCKDEGGNSTDANQCEISECDNFQGVGRRRRAIDVVELGEDFQEVEEEIKEYNTTVFILHPSMPRVYGSNYGDPSGPSPGMWVCLNQPGFLVLIVVLVFLLLIAIALIAFYCVRAAHTKHAV